MSIEALTLDRFLGGRVIAAQPADGFRAGHDTVLLAAAVPAAGNSIALELGSGAGIASLCLAARVPGVRIMGIEIDPELVKLANGNASRNGVADRVSFTSTDAGANLSSPVYGGGSPEGRGGGRNCGSMMYDHVFFNPPFHPASGHQSPFASRDLATRDAGGAAAHWTEQALAFVRDGGTVTAIIRADRVDDILAAARSYGGVVFPLFPREGAKPKRAIVRIIKRPGTFARAAGLILHEADGRNTEAAERVLRHAEALDLAP